MILKGLLFICVTHGANALQTKYSNKNHRKIQKVLPDTQVEQNTMYFHIIPKQMISNPKDLLITMTLAVNPFVCLALKLLRPDAVLFPYNMQGAGKIDINFLRTLV